MAEPWGYASEVVSLGSPGGIITLVEGSDFCISGRSGDIRPGSPQGVFFQDSRVLSRCELKINGQTLEPLSVAVDDPFSATFVARARPSAGQADSTTMVFRHRYLGNGVREDITIRNFGHESITLRVGLLMNADFADVFEVKEGRVQARDDHRHLVDRDTVTITHEDDAVGRGVCFSFSRPFTSESPTTYEFDTTIDPGDSWTVSFEASPAIRGEFVEPRYPLGIDPQAAKPRERISHWRSRVPVLSSDYTPLVTAVHKGAEDLGALRIFDTATNDRPVVAAGAPWFMALFGRDSIIASWSALMIDPELALGVLETLARHQGEDVNPATEEQPGRILHEMRFGSTQLMLGGSKAYYGSADSTPLFVMLLGELQRWGLAPGLVERLLPHADRALDWIENFGDRDGDGYVEYERLTAHGLPHQGWKDSSDGIRFVDGSIADTPIALAEVQAYVFAAYNARKHFAAEAGDHELAARYATKAAELKLQFNQDFWLEDQQWFAMALDRDKKPVNALASNMGHALWTGIIDEDKAAAVARRLIAPDMFTGWGVRTLSSTMHGYNPISYHCGSVWPHDTAINAAGLMRYGFVEEAQRVIMGLLESSMAEDGRLPEVFSGLDRSELSTPVAFPTSCSPQAWAAASPALALRTLLRFEPKVPDRKLNLAPVLPESMQRLHLDRVPIDGHRITIDIEKGHVEVIGLPDDLTVHDTPREP